MTTTGGCACGQSRFAVTGAPNFAFLCHCRDCQHLTGGAHAPQVCFDSDEFSIDGPVSRFQRPSASGHTVTHHFCGSCGAPLYGITTRAPGIVMVLAGALDDPAAIAPDRAFFTEHKLPWDHGRVPG